MQIGRGRVGEVTERGFSFHRHNQRKDKAEPEASVATAEQHDNENQGITFILSLCLFSRGEDAAE